jgi:hypothetical protein
MREAIAEETTPETVASGVAVGADGQLGRSGRAADCDASPRSSEVGFAQ